MREFAPNHTMSYAVEGCVATVLAVLAAAWLLGPWGELAVPTIEPVDPEQARPGWQGKLRPDPAPPVVTDGRILCVDPATGFVIDTLEADTPLTIHAKITAAAEAQSALRTASWPKRRQFLRALRAWVMRDMETLARIACRDTGKTVRCGWYTDLGDRRGLWRTAHDVCQAELDAVEWREGA